MCFLAEAGGRDLKRTGEYPVGFGLKASALENGVGHVFGRTCGPMQLGFWGLVLLTSTAVGSSAEVGRLHRDFLSYFGPPQNLFNTAPQEVDMEFSDEEACEPEDLPFVCLCACRCVAAHATHLHIQV